MIIRNKPKLIIPTMTMIILALFLIPTLNEISPLIQKKYYSIPAVNNNSTPVTDIDDNTESAVNKANVEFGNARNRLEKMKQAYYAWAVPDQTGLIQGANNAKLFGVKGDGVTDDTAKIQELIDSLPRDSTVFFPAGNYIINGKLIFTKEIAIYGEQNTFFDCSEARETILRINPNGSSTSYINDITITGVDFTGPGFESDSALVDAYFLKNFRFANSKMHNFGMAAIRLISCEDSVIEGCIFDNVFKERQGYGIAVLNACNNIHIRYNYFVNKGRQGVSIGRLRPTQNPEQYPGIIYISNNYFENMVEEAIYSESPSTGTIIFDNNVIYNCHKAIQFLDGAANIHDNVVLDCPLGIILRGNNVSYVVKNNTIVTVRWESIYVDCRNVHILNNILKGGQITCLSTTDSVIHGNYIQDVQTPLNISPVDPTILIKDNILRT